MKAKSCCTLQLCGKDPYIKEEKREESSGYYIVVKLCNGKDSYFQRYEKKEDAENFLKNEVKGDWKSWIHWYCGLDPETGRRKDDA